MTPEEIVDAIAEYAAVYAAALPVYGEYARILPHVFTARMDAADAIRALVGDTLHLAATHTARRALLDEMTRLDEEVDGL